MDIGGFENGEFKKVSDLSAKMYCNENDEKRMKNEEQYLHMSLLETSSHSDGSHCCLNVKGYNVEECNLISLKHIMKEATQISDDFFKKQGFKNGIIYVVYKICRSSNFSINGQMFASKDGEMKVWGYNVAKFKLSKGKFKFLESGIF